MPGAGQALQDAGCFAVVLECLPPVVAAAATSQLDIPTIGIGAGPHCSGQACRAHAFYLSDSLSHCIYTVLVLIHCNLEPKVHRPACSSNRTTVACMPLTGGCHALSFASLSNVMSQLLCFSC